MSALTRFWTSMFAPQNAVALSTITRDSSSWGDFVGDVGGLPVPNEKSALTISAVYASVNLISGAIAALPMHIYRRAPDGERDIQHGDPLWWVLNEQMTPRWSAASGWEFLVQSLLLHGDAFARIIRLRNEIVGLEPLHPNRVTVVPLPNGERLVYSVESDPTIPVQKGQQTGRQVYDQDDILHVAGFGFDGVRGLSPLKNALRMTGAVSLATQDYSARFFANSARPDFVLEAPNAVSPEFKEALREQMNERNGTARGQAHKPMVLTNGMTFKGISLPLEDLQLLEVRQFQIEEVARIYGIPPFMIGHNEKTTSWGSGVEAMGIGFVRYALRQHLNKFQNEINRKLFRTASRVAEFDTTELERADTKSLFEALRIAIGRAGEPGFITVNEARAVLNRKRMDGGETLMTGQPEPKTGTTDAPITEPAGK